MIDVHECLEAAKKIVNPPPRYNENLEVIAKIAKKEAKLFVGNKPRLDKTADKDKQEHAEIVAELKAFLELQKQQISLLFDVVEGGNLRPKQKFQFTSEQLATDDQKLQDAVDFFLATGLIPIRMDKVDVEGFYKYVWKMMRLMPYKKDYQIKLTDKMTNPRKKYFKKIEEVNPITKKPMQFLVLNTDHDADGQPICGRELDENNAEDWAIIFAILKGPIKGVLREYLERNGPWHLDFGAPQDSASVGGPPRGEGDLDANLQRAVGADTGILRFLYVLFESRFTLAESQRTILKYPTRGMPSLLHVDESHASMLAKAEAMEKLSEEHPEMSLTDIFLQMIRNHKHVIDLQGKVTIDAGTMKMGLCGHLYSRLLAKIAKYQNKKKSGDGSKLNFMSAKGDTQIDDLLKQSMHTVQVVGGNYWIGFWGPHGHGTNTKETINLGKFVGVKVHPDGRLSDAEIAQRMEYLLHGTQSKFHPSGNLKCLLPAQASICPPYLGGLIARIPEQHQHLIYHAKDKFEKLRYFKTGDPIPSIRCYSAECMPAGSYFPANKNDPKEVERFLPKQKHERMVLGLERMDPDVMRAQFARPAARAATDSV